MNNDYQCHHVMMLASTQQSTSIMTYYHKAFKIHVGLKIILLCCDLTKKIYKGPINIVDRKTVLKQFVIIYIYIYNLKIVETLLNVIKLDACVPPFAQHVDLRTCPSVKALVCTSSNSPNEIYTPIKSTVVVKHQSEYQLSSMK